MNAKWFIFILIILMSLVALSGCVSNITETDFEDVGVLVSVPVGEGTGNSVSSCFSSDLNEVFIFNHKKGVDGNYYWSYPIEPNDKLREFFGQEVFIKGKLVEIKLNESESCGKIVVEKINWVVK